MSPIEMSSITQLPSVSSLKNFSASEKSNDKNDLSNPFKNGLSATFTNKYYSHTAFTMEFTSADGDTVSLSIDAVEYSASMLKLQSETDPEKIKDLAKFIKDEFHSMKNELLKVLFGKNKEDTSVRQPEKTFEIPEYWNAENTSERIFEFAVSFYDTVGLDGQEYLNQIKAAIDDGFKQAKEILGELPEKTGELVQSTYDLVMQKLDSWAKEKGITAPEA
jgi:hypothetical protein